MDDEHNIGAGVLLEYWGHPNVVLVTYLCVSDKHRRRGLASALMEHVMVLGDQCARRWYVLSVPRVRVCVWFSLRCMCVVRWLVEYE